MSEREKITRREALKLAVAFALGYAAGKVIVNFETDNVKAVDNLFAQEENEGKVLLSEIISFRESLGLSGLPYGMLEASTSEEKQNEWETPPGFENNLPEKNKSYGMRVQDVMTEIFGENASNLVSKISSSVENPYGISFVPKERKCNFSDSIHDIPIDNGFIDYILHEAVGHGSDPDSDGTRYPFELLLKIEHGKWKALSKAFEIEGQFFNHPGDMMRPWVERHLGETTGRGIVFPEESDRPIVKDGGDVHIQKILSKMAKARDREVKDLKFNKSVCGELGNKIINLLLEKSIKLDGNLEETYMWSMNYSLKEIFAEMVKYSFLYQEEIGFDPTIMAGISEIVSTIRGEHVAPENLKSLLKEPSPEVMKRYRNEEMIIQGQQGEAVELTEEDLNRIEEQKVEFEVKEGWFQNFINNGTIPDELNLDEVQYVVLEAYGNLCKEVVKKYPMLSDTNAQHLDISFDPDMHVWDIREVEWAMDNGYIRSILHMEETGELDIDEIVLRSEILEKFLELDFNR